MQPVDYNRILEHPFPSRRKHRACAAEIPIREIYRDKFGMQQMAADGSGIYFNEVARISEAGALLVCTESCENYESETRQIVSDGDWIHVQFRVDGDGSEELAGITPYETPAKSCVITRYPENSVVERKISQADRWRFACLYMRPQVITDLLGISASDLPQEIGWVTEVSSCFPRSSVLALQPAMAVAVNDILTCAYRGSARRSFMKAKSIELLSSLIHACMAMSSCEADDKLRQVDAAKVVRARDLMSDGIPNDWTLAYLARRVGLNRSKLASGFKNIYGVSVRRFWRDLNLDRASRRLRDSGASITEIAFDMGYSDTYSFTRAFQKRFGMCPSEMRKQSS